MHAETMPPVGGSLEAPPHLNPAFADHATDSTPVATFTAQGKFYVKQVLSRRSNQGNKRISKLARRLQ